ncbi:MAG: acetyl-CoA carboxylase biotin carboxyl carrier protein [Sumerlaeia bacterium]
MDEQREPAAEFEGTGKLSKDDIKDLIELVSERGLEELEYKTGEFRIRIVGRRSYPPAAPAPAAAPQPHAALPPAEAPAALPSAAPAAPAPDDEARFKKVTSPMIGTFYRAPSPDSPSFVEVGDRVDDESVLCIIEAMKLMNEIKAEMRGTVRKVLVENGQPVEYGQPMFLIEPN